MKPILLNTRDAAALCGVTIKRWRTWNALGKIPSPLRIGNACFWKHDELIDWIDEGCPTRKYWVPRRDRQKVLPHRRDDPLPLGAGQKTNKNIEKNTEKRLGKGLPSPRNRR